MRNWLRLLTQFVKHNAVFLVAFGTFFLVYFLWWLAFYPGPMSGDSLDQWRQAVNQRYVDAHPFTSTLLMNAFRWIHDTPAWVSLIQVVVMSGVFAAFMNYAVIKGVSKKIVAAVGIFFVLWPVYPIYTVTIWKDIIFSIAIVGASLLSFCIAHDKTIAAKKYPYIFLGILVAVVALWRVNGIIYLVLPFVLVWACNRKLTKPLSLSALLGIGIYALMHFGVASWIDVKRAPIMAEWLRMKTVAAVYNEDTPNIGAKEREVFESLMPKEAWEKGYRCNHTDTTYMMFYKYRPMGFTDEVSPDPKVEAAWKRAVIKTALKNPDAMIKDRLCVGRVLLGSEANLIKYAYNVPQRTDVPPIQEHSLAGTTSFKSTATDALGWTASGRIKNFIFWSALPMFLLSLGFIGIAIKRRLKGTLIYSLLMIANPVFLIMVGSVSEFRYTYSLVLGAPLLILIYLIETRKTPSIAFKRRK